VVALKPGNSGPQKTAYFYSAKRRSAQSTEPITLSQPIFMPRFFLFALFVLSLLCTGAACLVLEEIAETHMPGVQASLRWLSDAVPRYLLRLSGKTVLKENQDESRTLLFVYTATLLVMNAIGFLFLLIPFFSRRGLRAANISWSPSILLNVLAFGIGVLLLVQLFAAVMAFWRGWVEASSRSVRILLLIVLSVAVALVASVARLTMVPASFDSATSSFILFFLLRSANLGSGVSPLLPISLIGGAALLLILGSLRRINLLEECYLPATPIKDRRHAWTFLNFRAGSFHGLSALEMRLKAVLEDHSVNLPGARIVIPVMFVVLWVALRRGRPSYPIDGKFLDWALRIASFLVYAAFTLMFLRFLMAWVVVRQVLRRLYWHPGRAAYENLRESLPGDASEKKRIYLLEQRPSHTAAEASLTFARDITARTSLPHLRTAVCAAERCLLREYRAVEANYSATDLIDTHAKTVRALAIVSGAITSAFDNLWRSQSAQTLSALEKRGITPKLTEQADLFVASRVVDLLRQIMPQLQNLAVFGTASMLLMLFAMSSYPFPQRDTLLWLSWSTLLGAVLIMLIVFVQMTRDRVISFLRGTVPGKLSWDTDFVGQIITFAVVPVLSLLGAQYPDAFRQLFSWAAKIGGGQP